MAANREKRGETENKHSSALLQNGILPMCALPAGMHKYDSASAVSSPGIS